jgi:hypothetical protein
MDLEHQEKWRPLALAFAEASSEQPFYNTRRRKVQNDFVMSSVNLLSGTQSLLNAFVPASFRPPPIPPVSLCTWRDATPLSAFRFSP